MHVYVGAYTEPQYEGKAEGISLFDFDPGTGTLRPIGVAAGVANPSFLALDDTGRFLYAVNELEDGGVSAFARDPASGALTALNRQPSHGADPCYVSLDGDGRFALVANYTSGTVAVLPVAADGQLGPATDVVRYEGSGPRPQQDGPHAHMIAPDPNGRFVLVTDLGTDQLYVYSLDFAAGKLVPNTSGTPTAKEQPGAGPRHFAFAPDGRTLYVINELGSTLSVYRFDGERGVLEALQTVSTLPAPFRGDNACAHVVVSPDGRFVYGSNRGHDSIAIWAVGDGGTVTPVGHQWTGGETPRGFALDPTGEWLLVANQDSDSIVTFRRDRASGKLQATGAVTETPSPVAILFAKP
jgi:6-phosphogluconolactonase